MDETSLVAETRKKSENLPALTSTNDLVELSVSVPAVAPSQEYTKDDFLYDPFGHGSLLEQAVEFIVKKMLLGKRNDMGYVSTASRTLNQIIDREMRLMGIIINEKFLFESMNVYGGGGWMRIVDTTGRQYLQWSI